MRRFRDLPIARKALTLGLVPTSIALIVAIVASLISTYVIARRNQIADVASQAMVVADNIAPGLAFGDRDHVDGIVNAMHVRADIDMVCVYDADGVLFSSFQRPDSICPSRPPWQVPATVPVAMVPVVAAEKPLGTVYIEGNFGTLFDWLRRQSAVAFFALVCGGIVAVALTRYLQRYLSTPIIELAATLDRVAASGDYSARAERKTGDEVGRLVESFNTMLGVIQKKDTERNELLQKSQESNRVKDEFLATVSHELRTPLNAMLGWLQILGTGDVDPAMRERAMASIERNAQAQARVVEDLIELSRVVTGKLQLRTTLVDLRAIVDASVDVVRTAASAKDVAIQATLPGRPMMVSGDRDRLQQVSWNLLSNAVKFTEAGGKVDVTLSGTDRTCSITVTDTGIGISPEFLPHIFDRFRQADQSTTREHGGLGLGLAIAKEITELHGGTLMASSQGRGHGSSFTMTLPRVAVDEASTARPRAPAYPNLRGKRILIVDDDAEGLEIASQALAQTGATLSQASSGSEALRQWQAGEFDMLICDIAMPGMDGYEVLRRIRTSQRDGNRSPAIALTALASDSDRQAVLAAGFDDHVVKPYSFPDLLRAVSRASADS